LGSCVGELDEHPGVLRCDIDVDAVRAARSDFWQPDLRARARRRGARDCRVVWRSLTPTTFGIFDVFERESGHDAHLAGRVAAALMDRAPELLAQEPSIEKVDVLASKLP
jgi:quinol monooxygenase YgiN